jgi:hypothetical protein
MSEKLAEEIMKPFDPILAEDFSLFVHKACCDCCPHDIGVELAQMAHEFYSEEEFGVEVDG